MLDFVSSYLCNRLNFDPLSKIFLATMRYFIWHMPKGKGPKCVFPTCGKAMGCKSITAPQLVHGTNHVLLTLFTLMDIFPAIFLHCQPIVPCSDDFQRESSSTNVATTNILVKLGHYSGALVSTYTGEEWVSITVPK